MGRLQITGQRPLRPNSVLSGLMAPGVHAKHHSSCDDHQDTYCDDEGDAHTAARALEVPLRLDVLRGAPLHCLPRHIHLHPHPSFGKMGDSSLQLPPMMLLLTCVHSWCRKQAFPLFIGACCPSSDLTFGGEHKVAVMPHPVGSRTSQLELQGAVSMLFNSEMLSMQHSREMQNRGAGMPTI